MEFGRKTLEYKGKMVFEKLTLPYFNRMPKEFEEKEACFIFVNEGEFSVRAPAEYLSFEKGTGVLAKCLDYFFETNAVQQSSGEGIEVIGVLFYPEMVEELFQFDINQSKHQLDYNIKRVQLDSLLNNYRQGISLLLDNPDLADETMIGHKLKEFIMLITKIENAPTELDFLSAMFRANVTPFKTTVLNNRYSSLSIEEFAKLCNLSVSSFKRRFKETFNENPKRYLAEVKVKKAIGLLKLKELRIAEIAYQCGFESLATFNRNFKSIVGQTPTEYRLNEND